MDHSLSTAELEMRMRPGAYSNQGFLGATESLEAVREQDRKTLERLGVSCEAIASALEGILQAVADQRSQSLQTRHRGEKMEDYKNRIEAVRSQEIPIPDLDQPESIPKFSLENLPDADIGYRVGSNFQIFITQYRGTQDCPWGCDRDPWSDFDFLLLNRQTGEFVVAPGMIVHLLREHQFFEGLESPYRVDPESVVRVLVLSPQSSVPIPLTG